MTSSSSTSSLSTTTSTTWGALQLGKLYILAPGVRLGGGGWRNEVAVRDYVTFLDFSANKWLFSNRPSEFPEFTVILCLSELKTITRTSKHDLLGDRTILRGDYEGYEVLVGARKLFIPVDQVHKLLEIKNKKPSS